MREHPCDVCGQQVEALCHAEFREDNGTIKSDMLCSKCFYWTCVVLMGLEHA